MRFFGISKTLYAGSINDRNMSLYDDMLYFKSVNSFRRRRDYFYKKYKNKVDQYRLDEIWDKYVDVEVVRIEQKEFNQWLLRQRTNELKRFTEKEN